MNIFRIVKSVLVINFINVAFPSGGLSGNAFLLYFFGKEKIRKGTSAVIVVLYYLFNNLSFYVFLSGVVLYLIVKKEITREEEIASIAGFLVTFIITVVIYIFFRRKEIFKRSLIGIINLINKISRRLFKKDVSKEKEILILIEDFYKGWGIFKQSKIKLLNSFMGAIFVHVFDIITIYILFRAINYQISTPVLIIGFIIANMFSFLSLVPSGFAVMEISLTVIYSSFGVPIDVALIVVLIFRFLSLWLPIPVGLWSYRSLTKYYGGLKV